MRRNEQRKAPAQKAKARIHSAAWRERNSLKARAHQAVRVAIRDGVLTRPATCSLCGNDPGRAADGRTKIRADHWHGYEPECWLDVQWVCVACDGALERARRAA